MAVTHVQKFRRSRPEVFSKKVALKIFFLLILQKQCSIKIDGRLKKAVPQSNCSSVAVKIVYFCITEVFGINGVLKIYAKVTAKHLCWCAGSSFNRVASL